MSSLIIKELIKFVKKKFAADKAAKAAGGEKKAECEEPSSHPHNTYLPQAILIPALLSPQQQQPPLHQFLPLDGLPISMPTPTDTTTLRRRRARRNGTHLRERSYRHRQHQRQRARRNPTI